MIAIKITSQNKFLDLFSDVEIPVQISNPLFDEGITEGSYLFDVPIPASKNNAFLLNYPNRVNKKDFSVVAQKFDCEIFYKFNVWKRGKLIVTAANNKTYVLIILALKMMLIKAMFFILIKIIANLHILTLMQFS